MVTILDTAKLITPELIIPAGCIAWDEDGVIVYIGPREDAPAGDMHMTMGNNLTAIPGMIDLHVHGGFGITFGLGELKENLRIYSDKIAAHGVTGFVITISGPNPDFISTVIEQYVPLLEDEYNGAQPLGLHLEGPFLNPEKHGAFNTAWMRPPSIDIMRHFVETGKGWIRHVSLAPELDGAVDIASYLRENGILAALGHSNADYATAAKALENDFTHLTHTFNAQTGLHHRAPGVVGAILTSEKPSVELIADGVHVHPAAMRILLMCVGVNRVCLITDAMPAAGLGDGNYHLLGQEVVVKDGTATMADGTFAGSTATMDDCLRTVVKKAKTNLADAARMTSSNPASVLGLSNTIGNFAAGKSADIALIDERLRVRMTIRKGRIAYKE